MQNFIKKASIFFSTFSVAVFFVFYTENTIIQKQAQFAISPTDSSIIIGHSVPECAYDDSYIPGFKNIAQSGESYFYTLPKLEKTLTQNPHVKDVYIEFTNNQLNENINEWIWSDKYMTYRYPTYAPFLSFQEHLLLLEKNPNSFFKSVSIALKHNISTILHNDYNYIKKTGGYKALHTSIVDSLLNQQSQTEVDSIPINISEYSLHYLKELVAIVHSHNRNVYFLRSPQHSESHCRYNDKIYNEILEKHFSNITWFDFINFPLDNTDYADLEHLNKSGAEKFSKHFASIIKAR